MGSERTGRGNWHWQPAASNGPRNVIVKTALLFEVRLAWLTEILTARALHFCDQAQPASARRDRGEKEIRSGERENEGARWNCAEKLIDLEGK